MNNCKHSIGIYTGFDNIKRKFIYLVVKLNSQDEYLKNMSYRFNYCPDCGEKINEKI